LDGGRAAGWLRYNLFWDNLPFLNMLYLFEEYRGKGYGAQLVQYWEAEMAGAGHREVLTSTLSNERGQFFFRKRGYTDCGALLLPGEPLEIILRKELTERTALS
ncbi:MAG: GNAT family N-acetyltransferase, partial [Oscillospiraceae bacterium]|nr:GNAT family N-acetyltransferase [Oscillospiraceae bacterium]